MWYNIYNITYIIFHYVILYTFYILFKLIDIVLIDGGERPKIAEAIIPYIDQFTDIFVHDFSAARLYKKNYQDILKFYDLVAFGSPSLAKFRLKKKYVKQNNNNNLCTSGNLWYHNNPHHTHASIQN